MLELDRNIGLALRILAIFAGIGLTCALSTLFWSIVERKRATLSLLALMGLRPRALGLFTLIQATLYALAGGAAAVAMFFAGSLVVEALFAARLGADAAVAPVELSAIAGTLLAALFIALFSALAAARRAASADPADAIRSGE